MDPYKNPPQTKAEAIDGLKAADERLGRAHRAKGDADAEYTKALQNALHYERYVRHGNLPDTVTP